MRSDKERLIDIQQAILRIEKYAVKGKSVFWENELIQTWILYNLQIIGEAVRGNKTMTMFKNRRYPTP